MGNFVKCGICGQFVKHSDFLHQKVVVDFTPDSHRSVERTDIYHKKCVK